MEYLILTQMLTIVIFLWVEISNPPELTILLRDVSAEVTTVWRTGNDSV